MTEVVVGCDAQDIESVETALDAFGEKYILRILGPKARPPENMGSRRLVAHLAGRFAAKEAVFKLLRGGSSDALPWPDIEISAARSAPSVSLHGRAAELARLHGIHGISVSISHSTNFSMAVAVATRSAVHQETCTSDCSTTTTIQNSEGTIMDRDQLEQKIRTVLTEHGRLGVDSGELARTADLYDAGMTSHSSVSVMLALEDSLDVEFPESALSKSTFSSIGSIQEVLSGVLHD